MPDRYKTILLFGAPGAGKGTQGKILGQIPGYYHLACGDVFLLLGGSGNHSIQERSSLMNYSSPHPRCEASPETVATYFADVLQETVCC